MHVPGWLMTVAMLMSLSIGRALAGEPATAVATITAGFVTGITVTSGGSGYTKRASSHPERWRWQWSQWESNSCWGQGGVDLGADDWERVFDGTHGGG